MADNARRAAEAYAAGLQFSGDSGTYARVIDLVETAIRHEREAVLADLVMLRDGFADDIPGTVYYQDAMKRLLSRWGHS